MLEKLKEIVAIIGLVTGTFFIVGLIYAVPVIIAGIILYWLGVASGVIH